MQLYASIRDFRRSYLFRFIRYNTKNRAVIDVPFMLVRRTAIPNLSGFLSYSEMSRNEKKNKKLCEEK